MATEALELFLIKTRRLKKTLKVTTAPHHTAIFSFSGIQQKIEAEFLLAGPFLNKDGMSTSLVTENMKRLEPSGFYLIIDRHALIVSGQKTKLF